jgi:ATP-dependent Clp protease adaptor protein ClpS
MDTRSPLSPSAQPASQLAQAPQWRVVFLNDAVSRMTYVVLVLRKIFGFDETTATVHMREAHERGRATLWVGPRERAEAYVFSLRQWHLMAIVEPNEKG